MKGCGGSLGNNLYLVGGLKMADVYLLCGAPGSGKTYWAQHHVKPGVAYVSRDSIRFSLLKENESYFSREDDVYQIFWDKINSALRDGCDVIVDQTSLTPRSRKYLIDHLVGYKNINAIWFDTPLEVMLERNESREGLAHVPIHEVRRMYNSFKEPSYNEGFNKIFRYKNNKMTMKER